MPEYPDPNRAAIPEKSPTAVRYWVLFGIAFASASAYLTRVSIGVSKSAIANEFRFSEEQMGWVLAAFSLGYFFFQVPTGWLVNRWGTRRVLPLLSAAWSLCSLWTGLAQGLVGLWTSRLMLGVAQAGLVPCSARAVQDWSPPRLRGTFSSAIATAMSVGGVLSTTLTAALLPHIGWRGTFMAFTAVGILWSIAFYVGFRDRPEQHPSVNSSEAKLIRDGRPAPSETDAEPPEPGGRRSRNRKLLGAMLTSSSMWLMCGQAFCRAFCANFFTTQFPSYLEKARGVPLESIGWLASLPLIGTVLGNCLGGVVVDHLQSRTGKKWVSRCGTSAVALVLCGGCTFAAAWIASPSLAVVVIAVGSACFGLGSPASWAATMDISGRHTAVVFGISNMSGNIGAFVSPILVGILFGAVQRGWGDWNMVLYGIGAVYFLGAVCWVLLNPHRSAVEPASAQERE